MPQESINSQFDKFKQFDFLFCFLQVNYIKLPGSLFLQMLRCVIIPLVIPSLIVAVGSLKLSMTGKIGARVLVYFILTTIVSALIGIILVIVAKPTSDSMIFFLLRIHDDLLDFKMLKIIIVMNLVCSTLV